MSYVRGEHRVARTVPAIWVAITIGACADAGGTGGRNAPADEPLIVAVQNLYVGTDLRQLLASPSVDEIPAVVAREFGNILDADFPERATTIAAWIARARPHLVGLQEASLFRIQSPGDLLAGNPLSAAEPVLDFVETLLAELEAHDAQYREVARYAGMDVEVPIFGGDGGLDDMRLTDHGVILARADVAVSNPRMAHYGSNLVVQVGGPEGVPVELTGGWASVDATVGDRTYRFISTHLESGDLAPTVQVEQATELLAELETETLPIVLVGDFSSTPNGRTTTTYGDIRNAGFVDSWAEARSVDPGYTCCQRADLRNPTSILDRRLDFIFYRPEGGLAVADLSDVTVRLIGAALTERTPSGLWPSDHAGLMAVFGGPAALEVDPAGQREIP